MHSYLAFIDDYFDIQQERLNGKNIVIPALLRDAAKNLARELDNHGVLILGEWGPSLALTTDGQRAGFHWPWLLPLDDLSVQLQANGDVTNNVLGMVWNNDKPKLFDVLRGFHLI